MDLLETFFNPAILAQSLPILLRGLSTTLTLGIVAILFGSAGGLALALLRLYGARPVRMLALVYVDLFRAVPVLVVLVLIYYALPFVGVTLSSFAAASLALSLVLSAFTAEVVRAGIAGVPTGQAEAAEALGLTFWQTMRKVVLPQALRAVVPPQTSNMVSIVKDTSLASVVALPDLLKQATDSQALFANPTPLIGAALIYVALLWPAVRVIAVLERRAVRGAPARRGRARRPGR